MTTHPEQCGAGEARPLLEYEGRKFFVIAEEIAASGRWCGAVHILEGDGRRKLFLCHRRRATEDHALRAAGALAATLAFPMLRKKFIEARSDLD